MERTALPGLAAPHALEPAAGRVRGLRRWLEPVALARLAATRWTEVAAYAAAIVACVLFANFALDRHRVFESNAYDFGFFDQANFQFRQHIKAGGDSKLFPPLW